MKAYLGIDVGSVSTNIVVMSHTEEILADLYIRTRGRPLEAILAGLTEIAGLLPAEVEICGSGSTGSGRYLAGVMIGADVIKNEITAHAVAASIYPLPISENWPSVPRPRFGSPAGVPFLLNPT